jgi:type IV secretory pathway VirJ component
MKVRAADGFAHIRRWGFGAWMVAALVGSAQVSWSQSRETIAIRGHQQSSYVYGNPQGEPVIVSSGASNGRALRFASFVPNTSPVSSTSCVRGTPAGQDVDTFRVPTFGQVAVYRPAGAPTQVVLFISGDGGWNLGVVSMAERLRDVGALVVGIDIRTFVKSLESATGCAYPAGALEELSRAIQLPEGQDLPLVEAPASTGAERREIAVIVSGDGGWAELDKNVAAGLAAAGVPTVGLSSLRYFWTPRTPDTAAADLARVITHYGAAWHAEHVILVGYSFGADVLPFLVNRLERAVRARVTQVALLGLGATATFEFHVAEWTGQAAGPEYLTVPEVERLTVPVTCVHGAGEEDSACVEIRSPRARVVTVGEGHHFSGEYARLVDVILQRR